MGKKWHEWIRILLVASILFLAFPKTVFADGVGGGNEKEVNGFHIRLSFSGPVKSGENHFLIQITDAKGMPVTGAEVEASAMPVEGMDEMAMATDVPSVGVMTSNNSMDGMATEAPSTGVMKPDKPAASEGTVTVLVKPASASGEYAGSVSFDTSGEWMFNIQFKVNGETSTVEFPFEVARVLSTNYAILAGFFGVNVTVVATAAVLKKRKPAVIRK